MTTIVVIVGLPAELTGYVPQIRTSILIDSLPGDLKVRLPARAAVVA